MFGISPYHSFLFPISEQQLTWPPIPATPSLLSPESSSRIYDAYQKPREEWSIEDWQLWAAFLEEKGNYLLTKIDQIAGENISLRRKLSRRKITTGNEKSRQIVSELLSGTTRSKGGRPATKKETVSKLLQLELEMRLPNGRRPKADVVIATYFGGSLPRDAGTWRSQMSRARKLQNPESSP